MSSGAIPQLSNTDRRDVSPKDLNSLQQIHGAVEVRITPGENGGLSGILISVVKAEHVALSINQASFKRVHYVAGDPITAGGGGRGKQFPTFPSHVPCTNALCQPSNYPISDKDPCRLLSSLGLLPSLAHFTSIRAPHFYHPFQRMKGISCSIPWQKSASKVQWRQWNSW